MVLGLSSADRRRTGSAALIRGLAYANVCMLALANGLMVYALVAHDFSVSYVAEVGSRSTPLFFTIVSLWASLNGSLLFWAFMVALYTALAARVCRHRFAELMPLTLGVSLLVCAFFDFLVAGVTNPFAPVTPVPPDGPGPNPLLQNHPLMAFHPPALYAGYVGMAVPYAMVIAALVKGKLESDWVRALRLWMILPWLCLTLGIVAGGWWSYEVLGWGGYWAWDPVENASFLPWLTATAFLHSLYLLERRRVLAGWTVALGLATFLLTVLGTFMTRSGVFNSVHSFTQSAIGPIFLGFLAANLLGCVLLFALRVDKIAGRGSMGKPLSRESAFLFNNLLFVGLTFMVLVGTVFPLLTDALRDQKISVGEPYFNRMAVPLGVGILFLMGVGPALPWGSTTLTDLRRRFLLPLAAGIAALGLALSVGARGVWPLLTFGLAGFAAWVSIAEIAAPIRLRVRNKGESLGKATRRVFATSRRRIGGHLVHLGISAIFVAIAASSAYKEQAAATLNVGQAVQVGPYSVTFAGARGEQEPHRYSLIADFKVRRGDQDLGVQSPRLNYYATRREPLGTPAVSEGFRHDLYLILLNVAEDGSHASVEAQIHPLVAWIWYLVPVLVLGIAIAMWPERKSALPAATAEGAARRASP
ncbi:MAG: heme lyase CcmF/NrfE family subunit [Candidatus Schekmanbacteria bacterium]|nr:heme lyase CcmF/NrfE family subunit [Candidatus Schekmanbacteria bacterium]